MGFYVLAQGARRVDHSRLMLIYSLVTDRWRPEGAQAPPAWAPQWAYTAGD